jgi:LuxR family maltose regulon positive regulatory protein
LSPWYGAFIAGGEARIRLSQGDVAAASRWLEESGLSAEDDFVLDGEGQYQTLAWVRLAEGAHEAALKLARRLLAKAETAGAIGQAIGALVLQALIHEALGERDPALHALGRALQLGEGEGFVSFFVSPGVELRALLSQVARTGAAKGYARCLLATLDDRVEQDENGRDWVADAGHTRASLLVDPLTERELEVLRYLNSHLSSVDIANKLYVSTNTVRTHIQHIYQKLNVHSRVDAVARADELGLI